MDKDWQIIPTNFTGKYIKSMACDSNNNKWFGDINGKISIYNNFLWEFINDSSLSFNLYAIEVDPVGNIWIAGESGIKFYDGNIWKTYNTANTENKVSNTYSIAFDSNQIKYFGAEGSAFLTFNDSSWEYFRNSNSEPEQVFAICIDKNGIIWMGTEDDGHSPSRGYLTKFDGSIWTKFEPYKHENFPHGGIYTIEVDRYNNKWIAKDDGGGLVKFDDSVFTSYKNENSGLPHNDVWDLAIDENDVKWIATGGGLAKFDGENWTVWDTSNSDLPNNRINCIVIDKYGNKWMGTDGGGVAVFREGGVVGIEEPIARNEFNFTCYPNPAGDEFNVKLINAGCDKTNLSLIDIFGRVVSDYSMDVESNDFVYSFNVSNLISGTYFLILSNEYGKFAKRIQIIK
jgi:ligand-binding sensor domain-containing protein